MLNMVIMWIASAFFLLMGLYGLVAPGALVRPFGIELTGADARTEVRAVYGGFGVAIAAILAVAAVRDDVTTEPITLAVAVALFGMAGGRLISAVVDRGLKAYPSWFYFGFEVVAGTALMLAV